MKVPIPRGSSDTTMLTFKLDLESSKNKSRSVVNNIGRALVAKITLTLGSKELEVIENCDIFDTYEHLYLTKNKSEKIHLKGIQPEILSGIPGNLD